MFKPPHEPYARRETTHQESQGTPSTRNQEWLNSNMETLQRGHGRMQVGCQPIPKLLRTAITRTCGRKFAPSSWGRQHGVGLVAALRQDIARPGHLARGQGGISELQLFRFPSGTRGPHRKGGLAWQGNPTHPRRTTGSREASGSLGMLLALSLGTSQGDPP